MIRQLPPGHIVRFDYHKHPRSTTAVIVNQRTRNVVAVGVAKFNPKDGEPNVQAGEDIALHRALRNLEDPRKMRYALPSFVMPDATPALQQMLRVFVPQQP